MANGIAEEILEVLKAILKQTSQPIPPAPPGQRTEYKTFYLDYPNDRDTLKAIQDMQIGIPIDKREWHVHAQLTRFQDGPMVHHPMVTLYRFVKQ